VANSSLFNDAVAAVRAGQRDAARDMLLQLVEQEPEHEMAWLWLSELVDNSDDKIIALENALTINPKRPQVRERLTKLLDEQEQRRAAEEPAGGPYEEAMHLLRMGYRREARTKLTEVVRADSQHEGAWLALSSLAEAATEQIIALENVLAINPNNAEAQTRLTELHRVHDDHFDLARAYEEKKEFGKALVEYRLAEKQAINAADRSMAKRRRELVEKQVKETKPVAVTSANATLTRLAAGPVLLYGVLIFIQSGLNPLHVPPLLCLALPLVIAGSVLLTAADLPHLPAWQRFTGGHAPNFSTRMAARAFGLGLILLPLFFLLVSAAGRISQYQGGS
jgi:tetratricopeptide (TPR) repeat protein